MAEEVKVKYTTDTAAAVRNVEKYNKATQNVAKNTTKASRATGFIVSEIKAAAVGFFTAQLAMQVLTFGYQKLTENATRAAEAIKGAREEQAKLAAEARGEFGAKGGSADDIRTKISANERNKERAAELRKALQKFTREGTGSRDLFNRVISGDLKGVAGGVIAQKFSGELEGRASRVKREEKEIGVIAKLNNFFVGVQGLEGGTGGLRQREEDRAIRLVGEAMRQLNEQSRVNAEQRIAQEDALRRALSRESASRRD